FAAFGDAFTRDYYSHQNITFLHNSGSSLMAGVGWYKKYFSVSVGFGPGRFKSYHDKILPLVPPAEHSVIIHEIVRGDAFCSSVQLSLHLKSVGLSCQAVHFYNQKLNNTFFLVGIELGILRDHYGN
ncbi:MAG: hypothetical protein IAF38_05370, partial [Bacteroidia bacterium]|nr:hypothetical protein [Bacteroidia bacterium]